MPAEVRKKDLTDTFTLTNSLNDMDRIPNQFEAETTPTRKSSNFTTRLITR